jgi:hypothetical protein
VFVCFVFVVVVFCVLLRCLFCFFFTHIDHLKEDQKVKHYSLFNRYNMAEILLKRRKPQNQSINSRRAQRLVHMGFSSDFLPCVNNCHDMSYPKGP